MSAFLRHFGDAVQAHCNLNRADAIGQRMVQLAQQRRTTVGQSVDQGGLPQRPRAIEVRHRRESGHLQDGVDGAGFGRGHPPHVEPEVEVGIELPTRRGGGGGGHHLLPKHRQRPAQAIEPLDDLAPVWRPVEKHERDDGGPQAGIALHRPGEGIAAAHELGHGLSTDLQDLAHGPARCGRRR